MQLTADDYTNHRKATNCYICKGAFTEANWKVKDHCHRTGCYRGAAHNACNINYFSNRYLPVVFHNLRGYDSHLIIKKAFEVVKGEENKCHPEFGRKVYELLHRQLKIYRQFSVHGF